MVFNKNLWLQVSLHLRVEFFAIQWNLKHSIAGPSPNALMGSPDSCRTLKAASVFRTRSSEVLWDFSNNSIVFCLSESESKH